MESGEDSRVSICSSAQDKVAGLPSTMKTGDADNLEATAVQPRVSEFCASDLKNSSCVRG